MKSATIITLGAIAASSLPAAAQSFNIEFGVAGTAPDASYAGVGEPGVWNTFDSMPNFQRLPLVGLDGNPIAADIMNIGFDIIESSDIATTSGHDQALLDDCFTSFNDPIDGCFFMRFLEPGEYRVIMYGLAPDDISLLSRLRIDQNTPTPCSSAAPGPVRTSKASPTCPNSQQWGPTDDLTSTPDSPTAISARSATEYRSSNSRPLAPQTLRATAPSISLTSVPSLLPSQP